MDVLREIIHALWQQDFIALADPSVIWVVYAVLFTTLFLENGLLPASFLPGDSLLLLSGALIAKGVMGFAPTLLILTAAAGLGCWLSYIQGRWLGHTSLVKGWLLQLPAQYHQRAHSLFNRHGLTALLIGRYWTKQLSFGPLPRLRAHAAANHGRYFRAQQLALPGVQLAERGDLGLCASRSRLCLQPNSLGKTPRKPGDDRPDAAAAAVAVRRPAGCHVGDLA